MWQYGPFKNNQNDRIVMSRFQVSVRLYFSEQATWYYYVIVSRLTHDFPLFWINISVFSPIDLSQVTWLSFSSTVASVCQRVVSVQHIWWVASFSFSFFLSSSQPFSSCSLWSAHLTISWPRGAAAYLVRTEPPVLCRQGRSCSEKVTDYWQLKSTLDLAPKPWDTKLM